MPILRLNVSNICNFSCKYCHMFKISANRLPAKVMEWETIDFCIRRYIDIMKEQGLRKLRLTMYGGEPLLNKKNLFRAIEKYDSKNDVDIDWVVNTNGSLMTEQDAHFFKKHNVDVHLSVDGKEEIHNKNRVDKLGNGTFERVRKALEMIKKNSLRSQMNSFVFPESQNHLHDLIDIAEAYGISRLYLDYFYATDQKNSLDLADKIRNFILACQQKSITCGGPWGSIFVRLPVQRNSSSISNHYTIVPYVRVNVDNTYDLSFVHGLPLTKLNALSLKSASKKDFSERDNLMNKYCRYCFLNKACNGAIISISYYHTKSIASHKTYCHLTRAIARGLAK